MLLGVLVGGVLELTGVRPAAVALAWGAGAGLVLAAVDLAVHRLPDRVLLPAVVACTTALVDRRGRDRQLDRPGPGVPPAGPRSRWPRLAGLASPAGWGSAT